MDTLRVEMPVELVPAHPRRHRLIERVQRLAGAIGNLIESGNRALRMKRPIGLISIFAGADTKATGTLAWTESSLNQHKHITRL